MKVVFCILFVFMLLNCSHSGQKQVDIQDVISSVVIDADKVETLKLSDFFTDISYVPLSDSLLISTIERVKIYDDKLFLLTNQSVFAFDINSGEAILNMRHLGQGPGEYNSLYDMLYDKNENTVELLDMNKQKVLRYGFDNHYIDEFKTSFFSFSFHKIDSYTYLFYNNNMMSDMTSHKLIRYDVRSSKITAADFPIDKHLASYFFMVDVNNFGSVTTPSFHFCPSDTIYGFTDNYEPYAKYVLNFGKHHTPHRFYKENYDDIYDFSVKAVQSSYIYSYGNFCENDDIAALFFRNDQKMYWVLYDKHTQTAQTMNQWIDDYHSKTPIHVDYNNGPFVMDQEYLYFFLQPGQLIDLIKKEISLNTQEINHDMLDKIYHSSAFSEESNPILVKCKFRKL